MDPAETTPTADERSCPACGSGMERHQDWCLECGTAAPGRLGGLRPGWRAVSTTLALTLVLVGGAGAASYAALSSDANREAIASVPADATPIPQAPPVVAAPPAPVVPAPPVEAPAVKTPATKLPVAPKVTPIVPRTSAAAQIPTPTTTPSTDSSSSGSSSSSGTGSGSTAAGSRGAVAVYDPYRRATEPGDPADAYDGDKGTSFAVGAPDDGKELQVGVVIDLEAAKQVKGVEVTTKTPGGRVEVYATDSSTLPPDILDTRWDHPASRSDVSGTERIVLPKGGAKYRYVVLWFTAPPKAGPRVVLSELDVLG
jgi:hypothetical protein